MFNDSTETFGLSSSSPFEPQPVFDQTSSTSNHPFAPKPFGNTTPFGPQSGSSLFGGTSTGVFGEAQSSSPFSSTKTFGAASSPAFGTPSTPTFGSQSSSLGGSSVFNQKPAFGGFGLAPTQSSPSRSTTQQSQSAFGTSIVCPSSPFGSTQPALSDTNSPFGGVTTSAFGTGSTPAFGSTSSVGFGSNGAFGTQIASSFAPYSTSSFPFAITFMFGQTTPGFSSTQFGVQSCPFGPLSSALPFGSQRGGSRVAPYVPTSDIDDSTTQPSGKFKSISTMPVYKDKSHEELKWEDYQLGDKGGPQAAASSSGWTTFGTSTVQSSPFASSSAFAQTSPNPSYSTTPSSPFAYRTLGFSTSTTSSPFAPTPSDPLAHAPSNPLAHAPLNPFPFSNSSPFASSSAFSQTSPNPSYSTTPSSPFAYRTPGFSTSTTSSPFAPDTSNPFPHANSSPFGTISSNITSTFKRAPSPRPSLFASSTSTPNSHTDPGFPQSTSSFSPPFSQSNMFTTNLSPTSPSLVTCSDTGAFSQTPASFVSPFQQDQVSQPFRTSNFAQPQQGGTASSFADNNFAPSSATQSAAVMQPVAVTITNPFGTLPAMPQISIGGAGTAPSVQFGIPSMPASLTIFSCHLNFQDLSI